MTPNSISCWRSRYNKVGWKRKKLKTPKSGRADHKGSTNQSQEGVKSTLDCCLLFKRNLMRRLRTDTLKVVCEVLGINKNSTVSSSVDRVKYEMSRDKGIRLRVKDLIQILCNSQPRFDPLFFLLRL